MKLTDTQLIMLSAASQRSDLAVVLPDTLKGAAARTVVGRLLEAGLIQQVVGSNAIPIWRRDEEGTPLSLLMTDAGLEAIGVDASETPGDEEQMPKYAKPQGTAQKKRDSSKPVNAAKTAPMAPSAAANIQPGSARGKIARLIGMLQRTEGAGIDEIGNTFGWLPHSSRAALSGLRRRGYVIERQRSEQGSTYRITSDGPAQGSADGNVTVGA